MYHFSFQSHILSMKKIGISDASQAEAVDDGYLTDGSRLNSLIMGCLPGI